MQHEHNFKPDKKYCTVVGCEKLNSEIGHMEGILEWTYHNHGEQFVRIMDGPLVDALECFSRKNMEYQENAQMLGVRGQFADIWRKIGKLKIALWEQQPEKLTSESPQEVLWDLIGHCLLTLDMLPEEYK